MDLAEVKLSSPELSDHDGDTFEDAPDTNHTASSHIRTESSASARSLTDRRTSDSSVRSLTDPKESTTPVRPSASLNMPQGESSGSVSEEATPRPSKIQPPGEEKRTETDNLPSPQDITTAKDTKSHSAPQTARLDVSSFDEVLLAESQAAAAEPAPPSKEDAPSSKAESSELSRGRSTTTGSDGSNSSARSTSRSSNPLAQFAFRGAASTASLDAKALPSVMSRKLTSPFAWLARKKTSPHPDPSPPAPAQRRRTTTTAVPGAAAPTDLALRRLDEDKVVDSRLPAREQLRERFKLLRMREEAGINIDQLPSERPRDSVASSSDGPASQPQSRSNSRAGSDEAVGLGVQAPKNVLEEEDHSLVPGSPHVPPPPSSADKQPPSAPLETPASETVKSRSSSIVSHSTGVDPTLAPGTVSGLHVGPSAMQDPEAPVDWDLWQAVVYEGPAAVAKTSAAELNRAIAGGIPSAIRGVVWQVLAGSKNAELESVYHELVARGTDKELAPSPQLAQTASTGATAKSEAKGDAGASASSSAPHSANSLASGASAGTTKDSLASSASSEHSEASTPATTNGMTSPVADTAASVTSPGSDGDAVAAAAAEAAMSAERQKKAQEDRAALRRLEKTIRKDLGSRSNYSKYAAATGLQEALFSVCKAYALFDEAVGYAQGMNFIVMPLLFNMPAEEAFGLLVKLMNQYGLRQLFVPDMPGLHLHLYQFERLLEDLEPALCYHLHRRGVVPSLYATQWFLTLFAYRFPLQLVLRVYDLVLSEGLERALLQFALALMRRNAPALLALADMAALKTFLNERLFDAYLDRAPSALSRLESGFFGSSAAGADKEVYRADLLVQDATAVPVDPAALKAYAADFAARAAQERAREAELETLRAANAGLALRVRALEARAERSDTDHVQLAGEMIRSKVETEEARAKNADLTAEVEALQQRVAAQPAEVEARLQAEMERIMSRNIEVQNENRALEEGMAEMEKDLVETKLRFAEINSEYEGLKQKCADFRRLLGD